MTRFLMPIVLIGIAIAVFFTLTDTTYKGISTLNAEVASYNQALDNSKALENERDKLTSKYNSIDKENLMKLEKFLPSSVDNIRLILEIEQIALPYCMVLKDVKYSTTPDAATDTTKVVVQGGAAAKVAPKDYGIFDLEFSISGSYSNFINFTKDIESNLRMVDISSITFSSDANINPNSKIVPSEIYKYDFKIKTYWLKN